MKRLLSTDARARSDARATAASAPDAATAGAERVILAALDVLPMHVAILDSTGSICAVNAHWRGYCLANGGSEEACGLGVNYLETCRRAVAAGDPSANDIVTAIVGMLAGRRSTFEREYACHSPERLGWFVIRLAPFAVGADARALVTHQDVTQRKLASATIEQFSRIVQHTQHSVMVVDLDGRVEWMNDAFVSASGIPAAEIVGRRLADVLAGGVEHCAAADAVECAIAARTSATALMRRVSRDGGAAWTELRIDPVRDTDGSVRNFVVVETDATARHELEFEIELAARHERERLARDLHDGLGQELVAAQLLLSAAAAARSPESMRESLQHARRALERATETARTVAHGISPVELGSGLRCALQLLGSRMQASGTLQVAVHCEGDDVANPAAAEPLYRIAQEALSNAVRHGHARHVTIRLTHRRRHHVLEVQDDGAGFRPGAAGAGLGLRAMRHRAESIGGHLRVEATPGAGTKIRCSVPD